MSRFFETAAGPGRCDRAHRIHWFEHASPRMFFLLAGRLRPWFSGMAVAWCVAGMVLGFVVVPVDAQAGEISRVIFVHMPAAWTSVFLYVVMVFWAGAGLMLNRRLPGMIASAVAPTGALFAFVALWTGALWSKPTWGTWWIWDARLAAELALLFLYCGFMALQLTIEDARRADHAGAVLALVGVVSLPIIYSAAPRWNTLHLGPAVSLTQSPSLGGEMLAGIIVMVIAFCMYSIAVSLARVRCIILERERDAEWVADTTKGLP